MHPVGYGLLKVVKERGRNAEKTELHLKWNVNLSNDDDDDDDDHYNEITMAQLSSKINLSLCVFRLLPHLLLVLLSLSLAILVFFASS